jgi:Cu-Zn family superoxide dismutase
VRRGWMSVAIVLPFWMGAAAPGACAASAQTAKATLVDAKGAPAGTATFLQTPTGVLVDIEVMGLAPGEHAFHVHQKGVCDPSGSFKSAGDHFAVAQQKHGFQTEGGPHAGDMPNLFAGPSGTAKAETFEMGITLGEGATSVFDADGSAIVVHAQPDDHHSQPAGNAGDRVACGVIEK